MMAEERMKIVINMGGEIMQRAFQIKRVEYTIRPSVAINVHDIQSLRSAKYCVTYGTRSEWLDIEELTALAQIVTHHKALFESKKSWNPQGEDITTNMKVNVAPSDETIVALASRTSFSKPEQLN